MSLKIELALTVALLDLLEDVYVVVLWLTWALGTSGLGFDSCPTTHE